jgi:hypothetical protein
MVMYVNAGYFRHPEAAWSKHQAQVWFMWVAKLNTANATPISNLPHEYVAFVRATDE